MDIDDLLERSAPPTTPRTPDLADELVALRLRAEADVRRRRPRRAVVVAGGLVAVLGLGGVATAAGWVPGVAGFRSASGSSCEVEVRVDPLAPGDGEPVPRFTATEEREALAAARASLARIDIAAIDRPEAIERWQVVEDQVIADQPDPAERQPRLTGDELETYAVNYVVTEQVRSDLAAQGLDLRAVSIGMGSRCDR